MAAALLTECLVIAALTYVGVCCFYNLYFHPLAKFPGPFWARVSLLWRFWHTMGGRSHRVMQEQHRKYGAVFRVSPNELAFASVTSWQAVYGVPPTGQSQLIKSEFYDIFGAGFEVPCVGSERNPAEHARKKKSLAAAFSTKALTAQEHIVQRCWDDFISKIGPVSQRGPHGVNVVSWFEMVTFDILGEMAFGESFGCVENENHHSWLDLILDHMVEVTLLDNLRRLPLLSVLSRYFLAPITARVRRQHAAYSRAKVQKRLDAVNTRHDFLTNVVSKVKDGEISREQLTAHASTLIIAGGETTAHSLSSAVYYLLKTPLVLEKLKSEVRTRFKSYEEIDSTAASQLQYLQAVIHEALRIHPSGAQGFPRISPGVVIDGQYIPAGTEVFTSAWAVVHDPANFHDPLTFKPERWLDPDCTDVKEASQPFSLGYRACLGRNFAWMEMNLCLAKLVFQYDWELVDESLDWEDASRFYIMWKKAPIYVRFNNRST